MLNVGKVIKVVIPNAGSEGELNYGSGEYLIVNMTHNLKFGGLGLTVLDCVAESVAVGAD